MKIYKYIHCRRGYDGTWFEDRGIVFAPDEDTARERVMDEHYFEGEVIMLEETYVVSFSKL